MLPRDTVPLKVQNDFKPSFNPTDHWFKPDPMPCIEYGEPTKLRWHRNDKNGRPTLLEFNTDTDLWSLQTVSTLSEPLPVSFFKGLPLSEDLFKTLVKKIYGDPYES